MSPLMKSWYRMRAHVESLGDKPAVVFSDLQLWRLELGWPLMDDYGYGSFEIERG